MTGMAQAKGLREQKKEQTRAAIAHTAIGLFLQRGFEQVSIAEIAEAAGVAKQTVTNYFPNKEDLVLSGQPTLTPDLAGAVRGRAPGESPVAALYRLVRSELDRAARRGDAVRPDEPGQPHADRGVRPALGRGRDQPGPGVRGAHRRG